MQNNSIVAWFLFTSYVDVRLNKFYFKAGLGKKNSISINLTAS